jgi:hypothetical protein
MTNAANKLQTNERVQKLRTLSSRGYLTWFIPTGVALRTAGVLLLLHGIQKQSCIACPRSFVKGQSSVAVIFEEPLSISPGSLRLWSQSVLVESSVPGKKERNSLVSA